jgi:ABC-type transport system involved in multi-copper enzyme maturation permease subunit
MTSATSPVQMTPLPPPGHPGFGRLLQSEWTKLRSVRSTMWSLVLLVILTLGLTALVTGITSAQWHKIDPATRATVIGDPVATILGASVEFGQLTIIVLGILVISSEYSTGAIRASLLAVPRRLHMLAAKAITFTALIFVLAEVVCFAAFFLGSAVLHSHVPVSLSGPHVARAVVGAGLYLTVLGLFSMAIGGLIRHTAGAIAGVIAFVIVLEPLSNLIPGTWGNHIHDYLPTSAGRLVYQIRPVSGQVLPAWGGFAVFCGWTAALLIAWAVTLRLRDA